MDIPEITQINQVTVQPGDVLAVCCPISLSASETAAVKAALTPLFPDNKIIVLDSGMTIEAFRASQPTEGWRGGELTENEQIMANMAADLAYDPDPKD